MEWLKTGWSYFLRGGLVMWPLLLCSVISLALTLERWKYFHKEDSGRVFPQQFCALLRESRWQEAWQLKWRLWDGNFFPLLPRSGPRRAIL